MIGRRYYGNIIRYPLLQNRKWLEDKVIDKPLRQVADEVGCSYSAVVYQAKKFGIKIPKRTKYRSVDKSQAVKDGIKKKYPNGRFGELSSRWKGGKRKTSGGHIYTYKPDHPHATKAGYVMEHRLIMEEMLGRMLQPTEIVHHINGIKDDNKKDNLELFSSRSEHVQMHFDAVKEVYRLKEILDKNKILY